MIIRGFETVFEEAGDGWWSAYVPELDPIHCTGRTQLETISLVDQAIHIVIEDLKRDGLPVPEPCLEVAM